MLRPDVKGVELGCGRRCLRLAIMRLPFSFWFLLLFSTGGLLLLLHLQDLTDTIQLQNPGAKIIFPHRQSLSKRQCPNCPGADLEALVRPVKHRPGRKSSVSRDIAMHLTKNHRKLLLRSSSQIQQPSSTPAGQIDNNMKNLSKVQESRKSLMTEVCAKYRGNVVRHVTRHHVSRIYVEDKHKLLYCEVPKAGCSNWKRVLMVLQGQAASTGQIEHEEVHYGKHLKRLDSFSRQGIFHRLKNYTKVLFVREPFEKLVSAFRDKFESPNSYYHPVFGKPIISRYRKNATKRALRTGEGVTFKEFIQYLLDVHRPVGMDIHWDPVMQLCSPCLIDYDFIGKVETIEEEANFLLRQIGAPANLTFPRFKDRNPKAERTSATITKKYFDLLNITERQRTYDFYYMDYLMFNYSKPYDDLY